MNNLIDNEVQKTLELLESEESISPNPYFYTRLKTKIEAERNSRINFLSVLKPATLFLLLVINISTVTWYLNDNTQNNTDTSSELVNILSGDLNLNSEETDIFNIE